MYKIKRFSWKGKFLGGIGGALVGASLANKLSKGSSKATLIGARLGLAGGVYLGNKIDKNSNKTKHNESDFYRSSKEDEMNSRYPNKSMESDYPTILKMGGMPKEYYQMSEICRKVDNLSSFPNWGDGDEYLSPSISYLYEVEEVLSSNNSKYINEFPIIFIGLHDECLLAYNFDKHQWFDISYRTPKRITNLKEYILKVYENDLKTYGKDKDGNPYLDENDIKEVERYYMDTIKIIKSSKLG